MNLKPRKIKPLKKRKVSRVTAALFRMMDIVATAPISKRQAKLAYTQIHDHLFARLQHVIAYQTKHGSWEFMRKAYSQATELYAVASLAYYAYDHPIMTDGQYDTLCKFLFEHYTDIPITTRVAYRLSPDLLNAGSGYLYTDAASYPTLRNYDQRLQTLQQERDAANGRTTTTRHKPRLLRKTHVRRKPKRQGNS